MDNRRIEAVTAAISYIEAHLDGALRLNAVAEEIGYSQYHLHRMFTQEAGMTPHDYIRRRQLTEAAKLLAFSRQPIMEIALTAGYESQQAFSCAFKSMYKRTPVEYRKNGAFYPLQLRLALNVHLRAKSSVDSSENPRASKAAAGKISYALPADLPGWMEFVSLVIDGFPCLVEPLHAERVKRYIERKQAIIMRESSVIVGAAAFSFREGRTGSIDFLAVHPQYRRRGAPELRRAEASAHRRTEPTTHGQAEANAHGQTKTSVQAGESKQPCTVAKALLDFIESCPLAGRELSITTFRQGDRADTGQRDEYMRLGFAESELLTEFGYPTQRLILPPRKETGSHE